MPPALSDPDLLIFARLCVGVALAIAFLLAITYQPDRKGF